MPNPLSATFLAGLRKTAENFMSDREGRLYIVSPRQVGTDRLGTPKITYDEISNWPCRIQVIEQRKPLLETSGDLDYSLQHHRLALPVEAEADLREYNYVRYKGKVYQVTAVWDAQTENAALHVDLTIAE